MKLTVSSFVAKNIKRTKKDFRIDTFRAGGKGGMNQNKVNSGVRITDLITGLAVDCREERDQPQNKSKAFHRLVDKLVLFYQDKEREQFTNIKELQQVTKTVRTYKLDKGVVIDHRLGKTFPAKEIMNGGLGLIHKHLLLNK